MIRFGEGKKDDTLTAKIRSEKALPASLFKLGNRRLYPPALKHRQLTLLMA